MPGDNSLSGKPLHLAQIISIVMAVGMAIFQMVTAYTGPLPAIQQRAIHLCFALVLIFLNFPIRRSDSSSIFDRILNAALIILAVISCLYLVIDYRALSFRVGRHTPTDFWIGAIGIVLVLEAARRTTGWALTSVAIGCLAYGLFGQYAPGVLQHRGYSLERLVTQLFMDPVDPVGVFGIALGVSASMVFVFILFGVFLMNTGAGELFLNTGKALFGRLRGGPAKMAVIASGLFGSVSGSASANVVVTGSITIPMMKRLGYQPAFAGAVEAAASTGGMIMPPIMGATAFLIADTLGIPYLAVVKAAAIPAILYYLSIYVAVDLEAGKLGLTGLKDEEVAGAKKAISSVIHMVVPLLILIYMIVVKHYSPTYAAFWSIIATFAFSFLRSSTRLNLKKTIDTLVQGSLEAIRVAATLAVVGIPIGILCITGIGLKLSGLLISLSGGNLVVLLILAMISSLLLGMGLPAVGAYVIVATLIVPAVTEMGVSLLAAHMFSFYFSIYSNVTPPVAIASYIASNIADSSPVKTAFVGFFLSLVGFIVPFAFVFDTSLLMDGPWTTILLHSALMVPGMWMMAGGTIGYWNGLRQGAFTRALIFALGMLVLLPTRPIVNGICLAAGLGIMMVQRWTKRTRAEDQGVLPAGTETSESDTGQILP